MLYHDGGVQLLLYSYVLQLDVLQLDVLHGCYTATFIVIVVQS